MKNILGTYEMKDFGIHLSIKDINPAVGKHPATWSGALQYAKHKTQVTGTFTPLPTGGGVLNFSGNDGGVFSGTFQSIGEVFIASFHLAPVGNHMSYAVSGPMTPESIAVG